MSAFKVAPIDTAPLQKRVEPVVSGILARAQALAKVPLTLEVAQQAQRLDTEAKAWLEAWDREHKPTKEALFKAHRAFTAFCNKMADGPTNARLVCKRLISTYTLEQQRLARIEQDRLRKEAEEAAAAARKAEVAQLVEQAAATNDEALLEEAARVEEAPVTPVYVPPPAVERVAGASVTPKKVGTVTDIVALLKYLLDGTPRIDLINELLEVKQGALNRALNRGLELPGVAVTQDSTVRNTSL